MHRLRNLIQRQKLVTATPSATVFEVVEIMNESEVGAIPIIEDDVLVGIFSERDLLRRIVATERDPKRTFVSEVMTRDVVTAGIEDQVDVCLEKMKRRGCRHLPVEVNGRVITMIAMRDLLRDEIDEQTDEIRFLRAYLHQTPLRG
jgi:CBS domain-containing protein